MGNKWGFHSGVGHMKDCKISGDLYVQDDIVFSGVSAGLLGVTGGIDMQSTTSAIGIDLGGTFTTAAINIDGTLTGGRALRIGKKALDGTSTDGSLAISTDVAGIDTEPANNYMFGLFTKVASDHSAITDELRSGWIRTRVNDGCHVGQSAGYGFGVCGAEIQLKVYATSAATNMYSWQNSAVWAQLETQGASGINFKSGSYTQCVLANVGLTSTTTIDSGATVAGITINTNTSSTNVTATGGFYGLLIADISPTHLDFQSGIYIQDDVATTGMTIGNCTTGISLNGDMTDAIKIAGSNTIADGIEIANACTNGINISGACADGIEIAGNCTAYGINISGSCTTGGIFVGGNKINFYDTAVYVYSSADSKLDLVADGYINLTCAGAGKIVFGGETDWGTGATGTLIDGTGYDWVTQTVGHVDAGNLATAIAASYNAMTVTVNQTTTTSVFGTWTELYIKNSVALTGSSNYSAVWGQVECGTTVTGPDQSDGDFMAAGYFNFIAGSTFTTGSYVNGVRIQSEVSNTSYTKTTSTWMAGLEILTKSGSYQNWTYGVYISGADTGIMFGNAFAGPTIQTGTYQSTADGGMILDSTNTYNAAFLCDDSGSNIGSSVRNVLGRTLLTTSQSAGSIRSVMGQLKFLNNVGTATGIYTGVQGYLEFVDTHTIAAGSKTSGMDISLEFGSSKTITVAASSLLCGLHIETTGGSATIANSGSWAAIYIEDSGTVTDFGVGIDIQNCTTGIDINSGTTGINITGTGGTATAKALTTSGWTIDAGNLTDGYGAVEVDLTMTGTATGHMAALSAWININTGTCSSGGDFVAAQTNGIYEGASGTITGANIIFGMRMDCICTHNDASGYYPFSIVNNANTTTALFQCNANTDMGIVSDAGSSRTELCPLLKLPDGTVKYVLLYDHT